MAAEPFHPCGPRKSATQRLLADPDVDGSANLLEFGLGSDPLNEASRPQPQASSDGANVTLAFTRPRAALGLIYTVETSNDLLMWTATTAAQAVFSQTSAMETIHVILAPGSSGLFLRVRVVQEN